MSTPLLVRIPSCWGELSRELQAVVQRATERFCALAAQRLASRVAAEPGQLLDEERGLHLKVAQECVDPLIAARIQAAHDDSAVLEKAELLARTAGAQPQKATET